MSLEQRLAKLEGYIKPPMQGREPILVVFVDGKPDTNEVVETSGILYEYEQDGERKEKRLNAQELKDYQEQNTPKKFEDIIEEQKAKYFDD